MSVSMTFVVKPWWVRFFKALELAVCGAVYIEGEIRDLQEGGSVSALPPSDTRADS